jgi:hypothetical protein
MAPAMFPAPMKAVLFMMDEMGILRERALPTLFSGSFQ